MECLLCIFAAVAAADDAPALLDRLRLAWMLTGFCWSEFGAATCGRRAARLQGHTWLQVVCRVNKSDKARSLFAKNKCVSPH